MRERVWRTSVFRNELGLAASDDDYLRASFVEGILTDRGEGGAIVLVDV
jgi:hypothetical protein